MKNSQILSQKVDLYLFSHKGDFNISTYVDHFIKVANGYCYYYKLKNLASIENRLVLFCFDNNKDRKIYVTTEWYASVCYYEIVYVTTPECPPVFSRWDEWRQEKK